MSAGSVGQNAVVYSRIPQSVLDSESSEEELHTTIHPNSVTYRKPLNISPRFTANTANDMNHYRPLGYDGETSRSINGSGLIQQHLTSSDDVRIIKSDDETMQQRLQPMGPVRTFFFGFSIFMCFFTVIVFLWVLPCDWSVCPDEHHKAGIKSWEKILSRIELKGSISIVRGLDKRSQNLVIMGRCRIVNDSTENDHTGVECNDSQTDGGLISLVGSNGAVAWWKPLRGLPKELDCSLVDVDKNGIEDCIVVGEKGLFAAVDPISGALLWNLRLNAGPPVQVSHFDFPVVLPDMDGDGVNELVTTCSVSNASRNSLIVVSGKTGVVVGAPFAVRDCDRVYGLNINKYLNIAYTCVDIAGRETSNLTMFKDFYSMIMNQSNVNLKDMETPLKQHKPLGRTKQVSGLTKRYSYTVSGRTLTLENRGRCPGRCGVTVQVTDERPTSAGEVVWNYTADNMYAMVPATLLFNNRTLANGTVLTEPISGFALKFWQWSGPSHRDADGAAESATSSNPLFRSRLRRGAKRSVPALRRLPDVSAHRLKERVVLITFNATDMHTVNASQNEVLQLCVTGETTGKIVCQPDLEFQEQSLLIADLDHDRSQELFSYYTTYVSYGPDDLVGPWRLQSKLRAIRLEAELPKLYEAVSRQ